jgi:TolB-like protein/cytochrome c-type biogenesis protein CcmH/NrfG
MEDVSQRVSPVRMNADTPLTGAPAPGTTVRFAAFELDVRSRELRRGSTKIRLQDQPFEILRLMLERPGDVVTREELQQRLWPEGTFVDFEHSLNAAVKRLRAALGDDADNPRFVETLPRRGYRFIAPLERSATVQVAPRCPRLAVLPFSNLSDESSHEYFSDGLTEELIAQLGPRCRGRIAVISRVSSCSFKGTLQRAAEIAATLHADYLLEGSVRRDGRRVRITVRLVAGETETELWSDTHDRTVEDWLSVQADVAAHVAQSLMVELAPAPLSEAPDAQAHQAYLKGRYHWGLPGDEGYTEALRYLDQAVRQAPDYAAALGLLARVRVGGVEYYRQQPRRGLSAGREAARRALALDPANCEAQVVLADVARMLDFDWRAAAQGYQSALAANPSSELAHRGYSCLLSLEGRYDEAIRAAEVARELDPLCLVPGMTVAWTCYAAGQFEKAIAECRHTLEMRAAYVPAWRLLGAAQLACGDTAGAVASLEEARHRAGDNPQVLSWLANALAAAGRRDHAMALISSIRDNDSVWVSSYHLAVAYVGAGSLDAALESLAQAYVDRDPALANVAVEPSFESLRGDRRFIELLRSINLA